MSPRHYSPRGLAILAIELSWIVLTLVLAMSIDMLRNDMTLWVRDIAPQILIAAMLYVTVFYYADLYDFSASHLREEVLAGAARAFSVLAFIFAGLFLWTHLLDFNSETILLHLVLTTIVAILLRTSFDSHLARSGFATRIAIVGTGPEGRRLAREILRHVEYGHEVSFFVDSSPERSAVDLETGKGRREVIPSISPGQLASFADQNRIKRILVATSDLDGSLPLDELLQCKAKGYEVEDGHTFYERLLGRILMADLRTEWLVFSDGFYRSSAARIVKRAVDLAASVALLVVTFPISLAVGIAIKLQDGGPALFRQVRVGENGHPFVLYKFRSMKTDAEVATGAVWAQEDDPRVTSIGRWIRTLRVDEIPQVWNVLLGQMSFVGPRPERPEFVAELEKAIPYYGYRHTMAPGITGWAQVNYPYGANVEDARNKLEYDLYYLKNFSVLMDLFVLVRTVKIILFGWGSR